MCHTGLRVSPAASRVPICSLFDCHLTGLIRATIYRLRRMPHHNILGMLCQA